jgi:alpha-ketoglutarate-dependent taurine dioxygenase
MPLSVTVVGDGASEFAARVEGVDASQPLDEAEARKLIGLLHRHKVICLAGQDPAAISAGQLERLANHFGAPAPHPSRATRLPGCDAIQVLTNVEKQEHSQEAAREAPIPGMHSAGRVGRQLGQQLPAGDFHTDGDYETEIMSVTLLLCCAAPASGGRTTFVDAVQAADALAAPDRDFADAVSIVRQPKDLKTGGWAKAAKNTAPLLRPHPHVPGRRMLQVSHLETAWIDLQLSSSSPSVHMGGTKSLQARILGVRDRALDWATRADSPALYQHQYSVGDLVIWCNYSVLHRAPPQTVVGSLDDPDARHMWRISVKGAPAPVLPRADSRGWIDAHVTEGYCTNVEQSRL